MLGEEVVLELSRATLEARSLDGSTTTNDAAAREQMNGALRDIARDGQSP